MKKKTAAKKKASVPAPAPAPSKRKQKTNPYAINTATVATVSVVTPVLGGFPAPPPPKVIADYDDILPLAEAEGFDLGGVIESIVTTKAAEAEATQLLKGNDDALIPRLMNFMIAQGIDTLKWNGFSFTRYTGSKSTLVPELLLKAGVTLAQIQAGTKATEYEALSVRAGKEKY